MRANVKQSVMRPVVQYGLLSLGFFLSHCSGESASPASLPSVVAQAPALPDGFVRLSEVDGRIQQDIRYAGNNNFLGRPVAAYDAAQCILTEDAALMLSEAQTFVEQLGMSLKIYDCYRPQSAVDDFRQWAADVTDERMRASYYPDVAKAQLFEQGYIAERSGHSRGSTVDLTLVPLGSAIPQADALAQTYDCRAPKAQRYPDNSIDMGSGYDCFDPLSHTDSLAAGVDALVNRNLLRDVMEAVGFVNYDLEWWHYTLSNEAFSDEYFDFPVR